MSGTLGASCEALDKGYDFSPDCQRLMASRSPRKLHEVSLPPFLSQMTAKSSNLRKQLSGRLKEMAQLPNSEWDFRWIADEHEADHVGIFEAARDVVRVSAARAGCSVSDAIARLCSETFGAPDRMVKRKDLDWVVGVFLYLAAAQFNVGMFPRTAVCFVDPSLELIDAMRKLRAVKVRPGGGAIIPPSDLVIQIEPGLSLREAQDALEFQFKLQRFELRAEPPGPGRPASPILRALSFYRYSMGRSATNLYIDFERDLGLANAVRPGRPRSDFGEQLYRSIQEGIINDPVNLWSRELARFEAYIGKAVRELTTILKSRP